jgi:hypothetical protein
MDVCVKQHLKNVIDVQLDVGANLPSANAISRQQLCITAAACVKQHLKNVIDVQLGAAAILPGATVIIRQQQLKNVIDVQLDAVAILPGACVNSVMKLFPKVTLLFFYHSH